MTYTDFQSKWEQLDKAHLRNGTAGGLRHHADALELSQIYSSSVRATAKRLAGIILRFEAKARAGRDLTKADRAALGLAAELALAEGLGKLP